MITVDFTEEQLREALDIIAKRINVTNEQDTPLERAERAMDSALLEFENREENTR